MALSKYILAMATLIFAITIGTSHVKVLGLTVVGSGNTVNVPTPTDQFYLGEPKEFYDYLQVCARKFTKVCGYIIYSAIVHHNATLTRECCDNVINSVGKCCYDSLIIPIVQASAYQGNASKIAESNKQVWEICSYIA